MDIYGSLLVIAKTQKEAALQSVNGKIKHGTSNKCTLCLKCVFLNERSQSEKAADRHCDSNHDILEKTVKGAQGQVSHSGTIRDTARGASRHWTSQDPQTGPHQE